MVANCPETLRLSWTDAMPWADLPPEVREAAARHAP